jgi:hypothetical protein
MTEDSVGRQKKSRASWLVSQSEGAMCLKSVFEVKSLGVRFPARVTRAWKRFLRFLSELNITPYLPKALIALDCLCKQAGYDGIRQFVC